MIKFTFLYVFIILSYLGASQKLDKIKTTSDNYGQVSKKNGMISQETKIQEGKKNLHEQNFLQKKDFDDGDNFEEEINLKTKLKLCSEEFKQHKSFILSLFVSQNKTAIDGGVYDFAAYSKIGELLDYFEPNSQKISNCLNEILRDYNDYADKRTEFVETFYSKLMGFINRLAEYKNSVKKITKEYGNFKINTSNDYKSNFVSVMALIGSVFK
ncbi:hypothetical protein BB561_000662 [Smittium simulii]|uniref:Uncharacterized protein n=1 Tax=Smittium simulii TaxID=133385 RepID=A0A2T9YY54_9FUNG|nr:hypothetical protein BB561_000662 [Smittium simulii]